MAVILMQPKKPVGGAFGSFLAEKRPEYTEALQGQSASVIPKMAAEAWQKLSDAEKALYQQKYEAAKAKYDEDLKTFLEAGGEKSKGLKALRNEQRAAKNVEKANKITDVAKAAREKWQALSEEAKKPFEAEFAQKMGEYKKAMEKYGFARPEESSEDGSQKSPKKRALASIGTSPTVKRSRDSKHSAPEAAAIDAALLEEAERLKLDGPLRNLISRPEVTGRGISHKQMLEALQTSGGLVNKAKSILLSHSGA